MYKTYMKIGIWLRLGMDFFGDYLDNMCSLLTLLYLSHKK